MPDTRSTPEDDPTLEELADNGRRLGIVCEDCGRFRYMKTTRFASQRTVSSLSGELTCSQCTSENVRAVPVSRDPQTGFWPAEHS